jgi:hypothetical protein
MSHALSHPPSGATADALLARRQPYEEVLSMTLAARADLRPAVRVTLAPDQRLARAET